jgi:DNA-binding response OmpR family regulator
VPFAITFVVDDEPLIASTLAAILEVNGYSARSLTSAIEAIGAALLKPPCLLVSDVMMPILSGLDLAIRIKAECPECKILLVSGEPSTIDLLEKARSLGHHFQVLLKPFHPTELLALIEVL